MQPEPLTDKYILCPFQIEMCDRQGGISLGTAFFYQTQNETFVITNWHNVTGKHPMTGEPLNDEGRIPLYIQAKWPVVDWDKNRTVFTPQRIEIEDQGRPTWFDHSTLGSLCDVVAIPAKRPDHWPSRFHIPANEINKTPIPIEPGLKVVVIGFPEGMSIGPGLPLIKTGFLSSTPGYEVRLGGKFSEVGGMKEGIPLPAMFLDVHTLPGMSGSPVFGEYSGFWDPNNLNENKPSRSSIIGTGRKFLGCHSSRIGKREERAGLGICYQANVIEEICHTRHTGRPFPRDFEYTGFTYK